MAVVRDKRLRLHVRSGMHGSITESMLGRSYNMGRASRLASSLAPAPLWGASIKPPPLGVDIYLSQTERLNQIFSVMLTVPMGGSLN